MSGKKKKQQRDLLSFWAVEGEPPPAKLARSEETVEEALDLSVNDRAEENESPEGTENETAEETEDDDVEEIEAPEETG
ncbi:Cytosolic carboxypeptidase 1 [Dissostichus eleginoides]|uniref:Cytosolic carboxypeptidase 1 n=1 Tax=Dissostichus eleginoides TaxID=100907 RepID=A0AAD9B381_DISEL|nr:Cytosolic carboxypeptidase 1 [Dissostichus eleginoides]